MVVTVAEAKSILGLGTDTSYDDQLETFIPYVEDDITRYCNTGFQDRYVYREGFIETYASAPDYLVDENGDFRDAGFKPGMDIFLEGGYSNVGIHRIGTNTDTTTGDVLDTQINLQSTGELITQDRDDEINLIGDIRVSRIKWPKALKIPAAQMAWHMIDKAKPSDVQSESLDDYSVTYIGNNAYPESVARRLNGYKVIGFI